MHAYRTPRPFSWATATLSALVATGVSAAVMLLLVSVPQAEAGRGPGQPYAVENFYAD
jgi:hypothetical protein